MTSPNLAFDLGFASWGRTLSNSVSDEIRWQNFRSAAREAAGYVAKGLARAEAADELQSLAEAHGLLDKHGTDAVQQVIAEELERAPGDTPKPNGHGEPARVNGDPFVDDAPFGKAETGPPPKLKLLSATTLAGKEVPPRRWLVLHRIPLGVPSILSGDGAAGKTTIALQLSVATIRRTDWLGAAIDEGGPVIFLTAEEDLDEIHRRLDAIAAHRGIGLDELRDLHLLCMPGEDAVLGAADKNDRVHPTPLFDALEAAACDIRPALIVIEAAADVFALNESNRSHVRQAVGLLRRLGIKSGAAVLLIQHPSLTGMQSNTGTSGSTHWNNAARSRLYFTSLANREDDEPDSDVRELRVMKANYGPKGERVRLHWQRGVFVPEGSASTPQRLAAEAEIDRVFLRCLEVRTAQGLTVGAQPGRSYAPAEFSKMREAEGLKSGALALAMERLLSAGRIVVETGGPPSKPTKRLVRR